MSRVILFDLGNTLAQYFKKEEFPWILQQAIAEVQDYLSNMGFLAVSEEEMWMQVRLEDYENKDYSVKPLEERLVRIFQLNSRTLTSELSMTMCRRFMKSIFALGQCYDDTLPVLQELRRRGYKMAVVSNTPWGGPALLWREELNRLGLSQLLDVAVFCRDVGWRKPARQIFEYTLTRLGSRVEDCVFVGDDPRWDLAGPRALGMRAVIIDRKAKTDGTERIIIQNLHQFHQILDTT